MYTNIRIICIFIKYIYFVLCNNWEIIVSISTILTPIIIAIWSHKYSKKLDKKILNDNKINRKANFQSSLVLSDEIEIILHTDSNYNYKECEEYQNVLLNDNKLKNGTCYGFDLILYFSNLTNIYPNQAIIDELLIWDNSVDVKDTNGNIIDFYFENSNKKYKPVAIDKNRKIAISALCCVSQENMQLLERYEAKDRNISLYMKLSIKNTCGIITNSTVSGKLKRIEVTDISTGALGTSKKKWDLKTEQVSLKIESIEEEFENE